MKRLRYAAMVAILLSGPVRAGGVEAGPLTVKELGRMEVCQLDALFAAGTAVSTPVGKTRGVVLLRVDAKHPRARARMQSTLWRGKVFYPEGGRFTNRWLGFRAIEADVRLGTSLYDNKPCVELIYEPGTPVFGNNRDELREIAPGLWLGRVYEVCPCGRFVGYFALELQCGK